MGCILGEATSTSPEKGQKPLYLLGMNRRNLLQHLLNPIARSNFLYGFLNRTLIKWIYFLVFLRKAKLRDDIIVHHPELAAEMGIGMVLSGPFEGMRYGAVISQCSLHYPKLLGSYESELHPWVQQVRECAYEVVVDVGAAEGYYAVGFARLMPAAKVIAYELDPGARQQLSKLASLNGLSRQVEIRGGCHPGELLNLKEKRGLMVMDCEGYEEILLTEEVITKLAAWDFLIETHDGYSRGVTQRLIKRFSATHDVMIQETVHDLDKADRFPQERLAGLRREDQDLLMAEEREGANLRWLFCKARV
jgi:hypothetical protein